MNSKRQKQRHGPNERDRLILDHVTRYRLTTLDAIGRVVLPGLSRNAVSKIANRLCDAGLLRKFRLLYPMNYFVLGELAVRSLGIGIHRAKPLGSQSLPQEFALLAFATLGTHQHLRLNAAEVKRRCPWLPLSFAAAPHCLDEANVLEIEVDCDFALLFINWCLRHYGWPRNNNSQNTAEMQKRREG